jgi:hypothetical protein
MDLWNPNVEWSAVEALLAAQPAVIVVSSRNPSDTIEWVLRKSKVDSRVVLQRQERFEIWNVAEGRSLKFFSSGDLFPEIVADAFVLVGEDVFYVDLNANRVQQHVATRGPGAEFRRQIYESAYPEGFPRWRSPTASLMPRHRTVPRLKAEPAPPRRTGDLN